MKKILLLFVLIVLMQTSGKAQTITFVNNSCLSDVYVLINFDDGGSNGCQWYATPPISIANTIGFNNQVDPSTIASYTTWTHGTPGTGSGADFSLVKYYSADPGSCSLTLTPAGTDLNYVGNGCASTQNSTSITPSASAWNCINGGTPCQPTIYATWSITAQDVTVTFN